MNLPSPHRRGIDGSDLECFANEGEANQLKTVSHHVTGDKMIYTTLWCFLQASDNPGVCLENTFT